MAEDAKQRLIRYLQDAHAAEVGIEEALDGFAEETDDPQIKMIFAEHRLLTKSQADRLEARLQTLGARTSGGKGFATRMIAKAGELMNVAQDDYDRNTQHLVRAYATEHFERAMYEALHAYATAVGDVETATLARQIAAEEEETAQRLFGLIQQYAPMPLMGITGGGAFTS